MKFLPAIIATVLLVVSAAAAAAPIYKWQDDKGQFYFSDQPPKEAVGVEQTTLLTEMPADSGSYTDHPYSIQKQVEFLQAQQERRQQMRLDRQLARQLIAVASRPKNPMVMPALDGGIPAIVALPRYQPLYYHRLVRSPRATHGGSSLRYVHQGDHHRFSFSLGNSNHLSYRNF